MPRDSYDNYIPSKADLTVDALTNNEIGGIGKLQYKLYKFSEYKVAKIPNSEFNYVYPIVDDNTPVKVLHLSGKEVFISLYNLAKNIDSFEIKKGYEEQIIEWCLEVCQPYSFDLFFSYLKEVKTKKIKNPNINSMLFHNLQFEIKKFMNDLEKLYVATKYYFALKFDSTVGNSEPAYYLYENGKHFEQLPFFESLKTPSSKLRPGKSKDDLYSLPLIEQMKRENEFFETETLDDGEFATTPFEKYKTLIKKLLEIIPEFKMKLEYDNELNRPILIADVKSVFDIAWYTFARIIADDGNLSKLGTKEELKDGVVLYCPICGKAFLRTGKSRRLYCDDPNCQRQRKNNNKNACIKRKKIATKKVNENTTNPNQD